MYYGIRVYLYVLYIYMILRFLDLFLNSYNNLLGVKISLVIFLMIIVVYSVQYIFVILVLRNFKNNFDKICFCKKKMNLVFVEN